ncbi:hypothetical protein [Streptomyces sp. NRRL F-4428]|nr:hypothetical protein [Streptomyces sp. NRRL F-4428]
MLLLDMLGLLPAAGPELSRPPKWKADPREWTLGPRRKAAAMPATT